MNPNEGVPFTVLAPIFQESALTIFAREGTRLTSPADLKSMELGMLTRGNVGNAEIQAMLRSVGLGSGLGLSMVYGFANQSGGFVSIDNEVGRGTTVKVFLPRTKDASPRIAREAVSREPRGRRETVLLVEDEAGVRSLAAALLDGLGYAVVEARDGDTALAALASGAAIDLLFTDVVLPGAMSGPQVAEEARRRNPNIKVLFMSGYPDKMPHHQDLSDDTVELLAKPFSKREMARRVRTALDQQ